MNIPKLEAEFLKNPNPSRTVLKEIARANGVEVSEVEKWFEERRLKDPELQDLGQDAPEANEANRVRIQKLNEKLDLFLHGPKSQDFFLEVLKILGPEPSEEVINGAAESIGVSPQIIHYWKQKLEAQGLLPLPVPPVQAPTIDRSQVAIIQPQTRRDGVEEVEEERGREEIQVADRRVHDIFEVLQQRHVEVQELLALIEAQMREEAPGQ